MTDDMTVERVKTRLSTVNNNIRGTEKALCVLYFLDQFCNMLFAFIIAYMVSLVYVAMSARNASLEEAQLFKYRCYNEVHYPYCADNSTYTPYCFKDETRSYGTCSYNDNAVFRSIFMTFILHLLAAALALSCFFFSHYKLFKWSQDNVNFRLMLIEEKISLRQAITKV